MTGSRMSNIGNDELSRLTLVDPALGPEPMTSNLRPALLHFFKVPHYHRGLIIIICVFRFVCSRPPHPKYEVHANVNHKFETGNMVGQFISLLQSQVRHSNVQEITKLEMCSANFILTLQSQNIIATLHDRRPEVEGEATTRRKKKHGGPCRHAQHPRCVPDHTTYRCKMLIMQKCDHIECNLKFDTDKC